MGTKVGSLLDTTKALEFAARVSFFLTWLVSEKECVC